MSYKQIRRMISDHTQRNATCLIVTVLLSLGLHLLASGSVLAQTEKPETASHRRLELPEGGSSDVLRQMEMLKQLQSLFAGRQDGSETQTPPVSPGQMSMIQQMMKNFSGQLPEDLMKQLGNLPPGLVEGVANDPNARQQIKDMLEQYSRDRQIPRGSPQSGNSSLPPRNGGDDSKTNPNATPKQPDWDPNQPKADSATQPPTGNSSSIDDLLKKLKDFEKQHLSQQKNSPGNTQPKPGPNSRTPRDGLENSTGNARNDGHAPATADTAESRESKNGDALSDDEINQRIDEMLQKKDGDRSPNNAERDSNVKAEKPDSRAHQESATADSKTAQPDFTSVAEFLKTFDDRFPADGNSSSLSTGAAEESTLADQLAQQKAAEEVRRNQERVKSELNQKGFKETLMRIARDAKREAKEARPAAAAASSSEQATPTGNGGLSGAMAEAVTGIVKDLREIMKDGQFKSPKPKQSENGTTRGRSQDSSTSMIGEMASSATDFLSDVVQAPVEVSSAASDTVSGAGASFSMGLLLPVAVFVALVCAGIAAGWKFGVIGPEAIGHRSEMLATASGIRTRADIVQAFHQLALKPGRNSQSWWTHQKVVDELVEQKPDKASPATTLSTLYEQARYLPDDVEFTPAQIENAKRALTQCQ